MPILETPFVPTSIWSARLLVDEYRIARPTTVGILLGKHRAIKTPENRFAPPGHHEAASNKCVSWLKSLRIWSVIEGTIGNVGRGRLAVGKDDSLLNVFGVTFVDLDQWQREVFLGEEQAGTQVGTF